MKWQKSPAPTPAPISKGGESDEELGAEDESSDASKESGEGLESCTVQKTRRECLRTDGCTVNSESKKCVGKAPEEASSDASEESGEGLESCAVQTTRAECRKTDG